MDAEILIDSLTAAGSIMVAVTAIYGDWIRKVVAAPKLKISLSEPTGIKIRLSSSGIITTQPHTAYFIHCKVVNLRTWITPRNCRVLLRALAVKNEDGIFQHTRLTVPLQYIWAPAETSPMNVDIPHDYYFDFGFIVNPPLMGEQQFVPKLYSYSNDFRGYLKANQTIRYSLQIQADNFAQEEYTTIEVAWNGEWSENEAEMRKNLRISVINPVKTPDCA